MVHENVDVWTRPRPRGCIWLVTLQGFVHAIRREKPVADPGGGSGGPGVQTPPIRTDAYLSSIFLSKAVFSAPMVTCVHGLRNTCWVFVRSNLPQTSSTFLSEPKFGTPPPPIKNSRTCPWKHQHSLKGVKDLKWGKGKMWLKLEVWWPLCHYNIPNYD